MGYTFPDTEMNDIKKAKKEMAMKKKKKEVVPQNDPKMGIQPPDPDGTIGIKFN